MGVLIEERLGLLSLGREGKPDPKFFISDMVDFKSLRLEFVDKYGGLLDDDMVDEADEADDEPNVRVTVLLGDELLDPDLSAKKLGDGVVDDPT